eukprot:Pgem_evm1s6560
MEHNKENKAKEVDNHLKNTAIKKRKPKKKHKGKQQSTLTMDDVLAFEGDEADFELLKEVDTGKKTMKEFNNDYGT